MWKAYRWRTEDTLNLVQGLQLRSMLELSLPHDLNTSFMISLHYMRFVLYKDQLLHQRPKTRTYAADPGSASGVTPVNPIHKNFSLSYSFVFCKLSTGHLSLLRLKKSQKLEQLFFVRSLEFHDLETFVSSMVVGLCKQSASAHKSHLHRKWYVFVPWMDFHDSCTIL